MIGPYTPEIQRRLQEIINTANTPGDGGKITQGGNPEFVTTFTMPVTWAKYQTLPVTSGTMNCTSLTLWITNQRNITGVCAPGGIVSQIRGTKGASGTAAMGTLGQYTPTGDDYMEEEEREGGGGSPKKRKYKHKKRRKQKTKRRRKRKTKRKRRGKKRKTRIKRNKARIKKKTRRRR